MCKGSVGLSLSLSESQSLYTYPWKQVPSITVVSITGEFISVYFRHFEVYFNINVNFKVFDMY